MFLRDFPVDKKRLILDLGIYASMSDEVMTEDEKMVVDKFCSEMDLKPDYKPVSSLDATLFTIGREFTAEEKRKIFFEIVSIVASDEVTARERTFLENLKQKLDIPDDKYEIALRVAKEFVKAYEQVCEYLA